MSEFDDLLSREADGAISRDVHLHLLGEALDAKERDLAAAQERLAEMEQSRDTWMDLAVERDQKLTASQERVDFLEAAVEAKSQVYEEDMTAVEERLAEMREAFEPLLELCHDDPNDDRSVDWTHVLKRAQKALSAATAGQVLWRGMAISRVGGRYVTLSVSEHADLWKLLKDHQLVLLTVSEMPEAQGGD